jgi:murein L,D-transpeptidase YcbB/YkuD
MVSGAAAALPAAGLLIGLIASFSTSPALAQAIPSPWAGAARNAEWRPFDRGYGSAEPSSGRDAIREWERNPPKGSPTLSSDNIQPVKDAIQRYAAIVAAGGWPEVPAYQMTLGTNGPAVAVLRQRLEITGDLASSGGRYSGQFDYAVEAALKRFQYRQGLPPTGAVDQPTLMALNVPASDRLRQLRVNLVRLTAEAKSASKRYVAVNIPAAQIEAVEGDVVVSRHTAVVGKPDRPSPVLRSNIYQINFNPYWHVPRSIVIKDLVPKARQLARQGQDVLEVYKMEAYSGGHKLDPASIDWFSNKVYNYSYRQIPWDENSMGFVKINFANKYSVYMHDTPSQSLFGRNFRAESSGCVRVENVQQLVAWLLQGTPGWDMQDVLEMEHSGKRADVTLKRRTPVYWVYITAWATPDGLVHFRRDLYRRDGVGQMASAY